jgi:hypothetical protein
VRRVIWGVTSTRAVTWKDRVAVAFLRVNDPPRTVAALTRDQRARRIAVERNTTRRAELLDRARTWHWC